MAATPSRGSASERGRIATILSVQKAPGTNTLGLTTAIDLALDQAAFRREALDGLAPLGILDRGRRLAQVMRGRLPSLRARARVRAKQQAEQQQQQAGGRGTARLDPRHAGAGAGGQQRQRVGEPASLGMQQQQRKQQLQHVGEAASPGVQQQQHVGEAASPGAQQQQQRRRQHVGDVASPRVQQQRQQQQAGVGVASGAVGAEAGHPSVPKASAEELWGVPGRKEVRVQAYPPCRMGTCHGFGQREGIL